ncbi:MAG: hypothetical protein ACHQTE_02200 [Candidatus Saccharimonadales bacterium]
MSDTQCHPSNGVVSLDEQYREQRECRKALILGFDYSFNRFFPKAFDCWMTDEATMLRANSRKAEFVLRWIMCDAECPSEVAIQDSHALKGEVKTWFVNYVVGAMMGNNMPEQWASRARSILHL